MTALLSQLSEVVTTSVGFIGNVVSEVVAQPLLLIGVGFGLLSVGVGLVKKFM